MSKTFAVPSPEFPGVPVVTLTTPDSWSSATVPAALMAVLGPAKEGAFRGNVVVSTDRLLGASSLDDLASGVRQRVAGFDGSQLVMDQGVQVDHRQAHLISFTYRHPEAGTLAQSILTVPVAHDGVVDLFELVGTVGADRIEEDAEVVNRVMQSFRAS